MARLFRKFKTNQIEVEKRGNNFLFPLKKETIFWAKIRDYWELIVSKQILIVRYIFFFVYILENIEWN